MCNYCNKNESCFTFLLYFSDSAHELNLCDDCSKKIQIKINSILDEVTEKSESVITKYEYKVLDSESIDNTVGLSDINNRIENFSVDADDEIKKIRKKNILQIKLQNAIDKERYEEAAKLRDEIASLAH